jgi:hypothetical protein
MNEQRNTYPRLDQKKQKSLIEMGRGCNPLMQVGEVQR